MQTIQDLAAKAKEIWTSNPDRRENARFAIFSKSGQYHGSFPSRSKAREYIRLTDPTPVWISKPLIVKFR